MHADVEVRLQQIEKGEVAAAMKLAHDEAGTGQHRGVHGAQDLPLGAFGIDLDEIDLWEFANFEGLGD